VRRIVNMTAVTVVEAHKAAGRSQSPAEQGRER
jgi:hypothetical protein